MEEEATADQSSLIAERMLNSHASSVSSSAGSSDYNDEETTAPNAATSNSHLGSNNDTDEENNPTDATSTHLRVPNDLFLQLQFDAEQNYFSKGKQFAV